MLLLVKINKFTCIFIRVVRYEDLKHSKQHLIKVLKFLGLQMHQTMRDYLYAQNEKSNYDHWKKDMSFEDIITGFSLRNLKSNDGIVTEYLIYILNRTMYLSFKTF